VVGLFNDVSQILPRPTLDAMATKFGSKIGYNSAYMKDISEILASNRGFWGSGYLIMPVKFYRDRPSLPWQRNLT